MNQFVQTFVLAYVEKQARDDVIAYGRSFGIVLISLDDSTEQFNVTKAINDWSYEIIDRFFGREIAFRQNGDFEILCLEIVRDQDIYELTELVSEIFKNLKLNENSKTRIEKDFKLYLVSRKLIQDSFESDTNETVIVEIMEMYKKYPSKHLDWLHMINNQLSSDSQVALQDKILINDPKSFGRLFKLFAELDET